MSTKSHFLNGILRFYDGITGEDVLPLAPIVFHDDFLPATAGAAIPTSLAAGSPWIAKLVKTVGSPTVAGGGSKANGTVTATIDNTSEKQEATLYNGDVRDFVLGQGCTFESYVKIGTLATGVAEIVVGLTAAWADGPNSIANSAYFSISGGAITCRVNDNSNAISAASGVTVDNTGFHLLKIDFSDLTNILFYIDGTRVAQSTTFAFTGNAAAQLMQAYVSAYKASGTGVASIEVDMIRIAQKRS